MKILQINAVNKIKSTGRNCTESADFMNNNGHEAYIAYARGPEYGKGYRIGNILDHKAHALLSRVTGLQGYYSYRATKRLIEYIARLKPEVVHLHDLHSNYINLELLFTYLADKDIPTVLTLHDCWFFTGKCISYTEAACFKWREGCGRCPRLACDNPSWFFDRTGKMQKDKKKWLGQIPRLAVVGVSDWITNEAGKSFLSSAKILTRIYNWIDTDVFRPVGAPGAKEKLGLKDKFIILGVASKWSSAKGLNTFLEISADIPEDTAILLIGRIDGNIRIPDNLVHVGETDNPEELADYYSMADVFFNPSAGETFGKVTAEALSCGTPVIVINSTANPELAGAGTGYVLEDRKPEMALNAIAGIRKKGKAHYSKKCVEFAKKHFNKEERIKDYLKVYEKISR